LEKKRISDQFRHWLSLLVKPVLPIRSRFNTFGIYA